ncbi:unnamed protein product [Periconia digitata]|uniref:Uncharacterized protein n=1 Tax=Periconia digitata TaxID=1303443 RepID=A0A9W4XEX0_9PLEO|nr:unnamed protein product [Periconia digitata]
MAFQLFMHESCRPAGFQAFPSQHACAGCRLAMLCVKSSCIAASTPKCMYMPGNSAL